MSFQEHYYTDIFTHHSCLWHVKCVGDHTGKAANILSAAWLAAVLTQSSTSGYSLQQQLFINPHLYLPRQGRGVARVTPSPTTASTALLLLPTLVPVVYRDMDTGPTLDDHIWTSNKPRH